jgi:iron complex transport system substrate-binding protein
LLDTVFGMLGMTNVVGAEAGPFPQVSTEFLLDVDPDFVFLADTVCCGESAETAAARPGWDELSAIQTGNVVELDDSIASRWSHRILDLFLVVAKEVHGI